MFARIFEHLPERHAWKRILILGAVSGAIAGIILVVSFATRTAAGANLPIASDSHTDFRGADACADCHMEEYTAWIGTAHARATSDEVFRADWAAHGYTTSCLECHATGFDSETHRIALQGISCEECHGAFEPSHPPSVMLVADQAEACGECHWTTYNEWLLSTHARQGITCTDCHAVHSQAHTMPDGRLPCASCHAERYEDFAHATHAEAGADCESCHMYMPPASTMTEGRVSTGHTFTIGPEACASCHRDAIHTRHEIPDLVNEVTTLRAALPTGASARLTRLEAEVEELHAATIRNLYIGVAAGGVLGTGLGFSMAWVLLWILDRGRRRQPE